MIHFLTAFAMVVSFFALVWHDQSAKPAVIERRLEKTPPRSQTAGSRKELYLESSFANAQTK